MQGLTDLRQREGSPVADELLKAVARRVKSVARDHDLVGRYGSDQFVVVAVHCDTDGGRSLGRRITECIQGEPVALAGRSVQVVVRIGCCTNRSTGVEIMEDLFSVAQTALADARARAVDFACIEECGGESG